MKQLTVAQWVREAIGAKKISQAELARQLQRQLRRSYDRSMVYKIVKGQRDVRADELVAIERITGYPVPSDVRPGLLRVPLLPWATIPPLVEPSAKVPTDDVPLLAFDDLGVGEYFALRIESDEMDRVSPPGSIIVVNRADRELAPNRFYLFVARGNVAFRRWHNSPPYLAPFSTNPQHEPLMLNRRRDVEVIGRVRRSVLDL